MGDNGVAQAFWPGPASVGELSWIHGPVVIRHRKQRQEELQKVATTHTSSTCNFLQISS
jgi:hypothetical protein